MVFCPECGENNEDIANFCFSCGSQIRVSIQQIEKMATKNDVNELIKALSNQNSKYRTETIVALSNIDNDKALKALIVALNDDDRMVRCEAAEALGRIGNPLAVNPLIKALDDENPFVICDVLDALAEIGDNRAIKPIKKMLNSTDDDFYEHVLSALTKFADASPIKTSNLSIYSVNPSDYSKFVEDSEKSGNTKEDWREDFERHMKERNDRKLKEEIISSVNYLKSDNRKKRYDAVNKLVNIGLPAFDYVMGASESKNSVTRRKVCDVLGLMGDTRAIKTLIKLLNDKNIHVRRRAANALILVNNKEAVDPLCAALNDSEYKVRGRAARALGNIGDYRAVDALIKSSKDYVSAVRQESLEALNKIGWNPENNEKSAYFWISQKRFDKCVEIGQPAVMPLIRSFDSDSETRNQAVNAIVQIGEPAVDPLIHALNNIKPVIARKACDALGHIGDPRAVIPLSERLNDPEKYVRRRAANALILIGDERAVKPLCKALNDSETKVRVRAATALGKIGDKNAVSSLVLRLDDDSYEVSKAVSEALNKMGSEGRNALRRHDEKIKAEKERKRKLREKKKAEESVRYLTDKNAYAPYEHVTEREVWKMEKKRDVEGLLKCSIITYNDSFFNYESEDQRKAKTIAFQIVVNDIGEEAILKLIPLLNHPDIKIRLQTIEAFYKIGDKMLSNAHSEFYDEYETSLDVFNYLSGGYDCYFDVEKAASEVWDILNFVNSDVNAFNKLEKSMDNALTLINNSDITDERALYSNVFDAAEQIKKGIKKYSGRFAEGRDALSQLIQNTYVKEVREAAEKAIKRYYFLPIDGLFSKGGLDDDEKDTIKIVIREETTTNQSNKSYSQQLIEENDNYMDDIISGLYGPRR